MQGSPPAGPCHSVQILFCHKRHFPFAISPVYSLVAVVLIMANTTHRKRGAHKHMDVYFSEGSRNILILTVSTTTEPERGGRNVVRGKIDFDW